MRDLQTLVDQADVPALLAAIDGMCATRDWDDLVDLARRCHAAVELGRQLWGVAMHVDYRLALEAPGSYAGRVVAPGAGRFTLGPLTEVAASTHDWAALRDHLGDPASTAAVAQERVLRGEDLIGDGVAAAAPGDGLPLRLEAWEPSYVLPTYRDRSAKFPAPEVTARSLPRARGLEPCAGERDPATLALLEVVETWTTQSAGIARAASVEGAAAAAVGALVTRAALSEISPQDALAWLQWAGASGGAHGRRRGGAAGRFSAWWAGAALTGLAWPVDADEFGAALAELRWYRWAPPTAETGWVLRLAVHDPVDHLAWAIDASDATEDDDEP